MKARLGIYGGLLALSLTACATDDPRQGGLFGGLVGLSSGAYRERISEERTSLQTEKARHQEEVEDGQRLDGLLKEKQSEAIDLEHAVYAIGQDIEALESDIKALKKEETLTRDQIETAEADLVALQRKIDRIEAARGAEEQAKALGADADVDTDPAEFGEPSQDQVSDLRAYIVELQKAIDALQSTRDNLAVSSAD